MFDKLKNLAFANKPKDIRQSDEYKTVASSKYFDKSFYLKSNPDVANSGMDPIEHYILFGWKEGRSPSKLMDSIMVSPQGNNIRKAAINPILYISSNTAAESVAPKKAPVPKPSVQASKSPQKTETSISFEAMFNVLAFSLDRFKEQNPFKKNILLITHTFDNTGAPRALLQMAKTVKDLGHNPIVLSFKNGNLRSFCNENSIPVLLTPLSNLDGKALDKHTARFIRAFDCIVFNTLVTMRVADTFKNVKCYKMAWVHEGKFEFDNASNKVVNFEYAFGCMDDVYAGGEYAKKYVDKHMPIGKKAKVLLYGIEDVDEDFGEEEDSVDLSVSEVAEESEEKKLLFYITGTFSKRKGQDIVINALPLIPNEIMEKIEFRFIGSTRDQEMTMLMNSALSEYDNIKIIDEMPLQELQKTVKNEADVLLCPSRDDPMPIVVTEAMKMKKVVAVSQQTGTSQYIENGVNGYVLGDLTSEALGELVIEIYDNRNRNEEIGEKAREVYDTYFTLDIFKSNVKRIIDQMEMLRIGVWKNDESQA